jgi:hypothetical protein
MPSIPAPSERDSLRLTLYVPRKKHAELYDFLSALPEGNGPSFVRDVLEKYIQSGGFPPSGQTPPTVNQVAVTDRLPAATPIRARLAEGGMK